MFHSNELHYLSTRYSRMQASNGKLWVYRFSIFKCFIKILSSVAHNRRYDFSMGSWSSACRWRWHRITTTSIDQELHCWLYTSNDMKVEKDFNGNIWSLQVYSTGNFTCLEVVFVLKRRLGYYLFHTYIPTCLIVIMSVNKDQSFISEAFKNWQISSGFRFGSNRKQLQLEWLSVSLPFWHFQRNTQSLKQVYRPYRI